MSLLLFPLLGQEQFIYAMDWRYVVPSHHVVQDGPRVILRCRTGRLTEIVDVGVGEVVCLKGFWTPGPVAY